MRRAASTQRCDDYEPFRLTTARRDGAFQDVSGGRRQPGRAQGRAAENEPTRIAEALAHGADEYIMKPFDGDIVAYKFSQAGLL